MKYDWGFAITGSSRFDNETNLGFVETGSRRQSEFCQVPTGKAKAGRSSPDSQGTEECSEQLAINLIQGKGKTRILSRLPHGRVRLSELRRMSPEPSTKMA
jgi:hypothetical protein